MALADQITLDSEESASAVFEGLLLTGLGMSFVKNSRPASGTEHILSHFRDICLFSSLARNLFTNFFLQSTREQSS